MVVQIGAHTAVGSGDPLREHHAAEANCAESSMYLRSDQALEVPDLQFMFIHVPFHPPHLESPENSFTIAVGAMTPASRGSLKLRSADRVITH